MSFTLHKYYSWFHGRPLKERGSWLNFHFSKKKLSFYSFEHDICNAILNFNTNSIGNITFQMKLNLFFFKISWQKWKEFFLFFALLPNNTRNIQKLLKMFKTLKVLSVSCMVPSAYNYLWYPITICYSRLTSQPLKRWSWSTPIEYNIQLHIATPSERLKLMTFLWDIWNCENSISTFQLSNYATKKKTIVTTATKEQTHPPFTIHNLHSIGYGEIV